MTEICVRCREDGEDRRTLRMACFYAMEEMKIPFEQETVLRAPGDAEYEIVKPATTIPVREGPAITLSPPTIKVSSELTPMGLYTLRVCKDCRSSWMEAIKQWFLADPETDFAKRRVGSGIFVRRNGANVEVTEEEWHALVAAQQAALVAKAEGDT